MKGPILFIQLSPDTPLGSEESLRLVAGTSEAMIVADATEADKLIASTRDFATIVCNAPDATLFNAMRAKQPKAKTVLVTSLPMKDYSEKLREEETRLLDHVIAHHTHASATTHELRTTLAKIATGDIFGIEKYLTSGTPVQRATIRGTKDRERQNQAVMAFAETCQLGQHQSKSIFGVTEELLMNTIHDAPVAAGRKEYLNVPRTDPLELKPDEYGELSYGCDGQTFAVATSDPFGALGRDTLFKYTRKILLRRDSDALIDKKAGGAGLGFFKILFASHGLVCNVSAQKRTEIIALIDCGEPLRDFARMARSIHYFSV